MQALSRRTSGDGSSRRRSRVPLSRRFTYRYLLALLIFAVIAVLWRFTIDASANRISDLTKQRTAAVEQAARLQRLSLVASQIYNVNDDNAAVKGSFDLGTANSSLQQEAVQLRDVQRALMDGDPKLGLPQTEVSPRLQQIYKDPDRLEQTIVEIASAAENMAGIRETNTSGQKKRETFYTTITSQQEEAAKGLEKAKSAYTDEINAEIQTQENNNDIFLGISLLATLLVGFVLFRPMARSIHLETSQLEAAERVHRENNERQTFRNELSQALEVTDNEGEVLAAVGRAFVTVVPERQVELLLSDASNSHLRVAQVSPSRGAAGCPVEGPQGCAAIRRGQSVVYESSRMLNVCPKLPEHTQGVCSAVCTPVMFMGSALGVLHTVGPDGQPPSHTEIERLSVLASETGNRLGLLRHSQATELQATTDGLTGLFNRRTLESKARGLLLDKQPFSIAMADLDHFKHLNDQHGHEAGDRALRMFAGVLRASLRPEDFSARYGGEEFIVLLPHTSINEAIRAVERLQVALRAEVERAGGIAFTASWGLTDSASGQTFDEIVAVADAALYSAKRAGRDCLMVDGEAAASAGANADTIDDAGHPGPGSGTPGDGHAPSMAPHTPTPGTAPAAGRAPVPPVRAHVHHDTTPLLEIDMDLLDASPGNEPQG